MQFTSPVNQPSPAAPNNVLSKPNIKPCPEFKDSHASAARRGHQATRSSNHNSVVGDNSNNDQDSSLASLWRRHRMLFFHISPCLKYLQATIKLPLDKLLDLCNEEMPSTPSALDANATTKCTGSGDVVMQDPPGAYMHSYIQGPSPSISKTGATPTPGTSATSTSGTNTGT
ncbi:hypothetical protein M404DRAFT_35880 [Pisolithus tinctorius Marx 270]|nr:hypothetical protein M404DRAFT_35880 [Pisolithus tinctorius Marx 270]